MPSNSNEYDRAYREATRRLRVKHMKEFNKIFEQVKKELNITVTRLVK